MSLPGLPALGLADLACLLLLGLLGLLAHDSACSRTTLPTDSTCSRTAPDSVRGALSASTRRSMSS